MIQIQEYKPVAPIILTIQSVTVNKDEECKLTVSATASDGGTLSYQWYEASAENAREITAISGAVGRTFACDTTKGGARYYQCKVINTKNGKTNDAFSDIVTVTVKTPVPTPIYNTEKANVNPGETVELKITLSLSESERGKLTYQWYESSKNDPDEGKAVSGANSETYTVSGNAHSGTTRYYFCKITNELNGEKYTNMDDDMSMVEIIFAGEHVHDYGAWKVKTEPTCTEDGTKTRSCECGEKLTETIPATGHAYGEWTIKTTATENTEGLEERTCTHCNSAETRVIPVVAVPSAAETVISEIPDAQTPNIQNPTPWWIFVASGCLIVISIVAWRIVKRKKS